MAGERSSSSSVASSLHLAGGLQKRNPLKASLSKQKQTRSRGSRSGAEQSLESLERHRDDLKATLRAWAKSKPGGVPSAADCEAMKAELTDFAELKARIDELKQQQRRRRGGEGEEEDR